MATRTSLSTVELALACRALIHSVMPAAVEIVWPTQGNAGYGTGPKKMTEQFCWIAPASKHVGLGFYRGVELADPARLLEGTGKKMRHVKIRSLTDVANPALRDLVVAAAAHDQSPLSR